MTPGEVGTEAGRIFEYNLPSNWIFRSQEDQNDHGIDGEIEVKDNNGKAQGSDFLFKIQIKGEITCSFINKGETLSFNIKSRKLRYYLSFNIPIILVVVEIASESVYWISVTDNEELITKAANIKTESIQIHLPTKNTLKRRDDPLAQGMLNSVLASWDYLAIKGVKGSIQRFANLDPERLDSRINEMGNALYKAHHQQLENLLQNRDFAKAYQLSSDLIKSAIVPTGDRFVAALFYRTALKLAPRHLAVAQQMSDITNISLILIQLARQERSINLRRYAFGLARSAKFRYEINSMFANHNAAKALTGSPEEYIFRRETYNQYTSVCISLKK